MSNLREVSLREVEEKIYHLCLKAGRRLGEDVSHALEKAAKKETSPAAQKTLELLLANIQVAGENNLPLCQDTGMAVIYLDIGQDVHITGGDLEEGVNAAVRRAYADGPFRASVLSPLRRVNTGDNTPAVLHIRIVPGDKIHITVAPKGFGSENMSRIGMLKPSAGISGAKDFVVESVKLAGGNPCPPVVVGVGFGGTFERCAAIAKRALLRPLGLHNPDPFYAEMEQELLERINDLGIGPMGLGGRTTALAVHIESFPTHIAGMPVAVNMQCHCARHAQGEV